jgi:hypothetical protein
MQNLIDRIVGVFAPEQSRDAIAAVILQARSESFAAGREAAIREFEKTINGPEFGAEVNKQLSDIFDEGYKAGFDAASEGAEEAIDSEADVAYGEGKAQGYHDGLAEGVEIGLEVAERRQLSGRVA